MKRDRIVISLLIFSLFFILKDPACEENRSSGLKEQIATLKERLKNNEEEERELIRRLNSLTKQIYETEERISKLKQEISNVDREIEDLNIELKSLETQLKGLQARLSKRLLVMYRARHLGYLEAILTSDNIASLVRRTHFMRLVAREDARLINELKENISRILKKKGALFDKQQELDRLKRVEEVAKRLRESQLKSRKVLLDRVRKQRSIYITRIKELEEAFLRVTKSRFKKGNSPSPELLRLKNHLAWPINGGKLVRRFGSFYHSKFETEVTNKGIDIAAPYNDVVFSVLNGKVVFADYLKGYGRLTMIDHGYGLYSIYANLAQILVKKGQIIGKGVPIGKVGNSWAIGESGLHFELRVNGEPVDPLEWLSR